MYLLNVFWKKGIAFYFLFAHVKLSFAWNRTHMSFDSLLSFSRCTVRTVRHLAWWWRCLWLKTPTWRSRCRFLSGRTSGKSVNVAWRTSNTSSVSWMRQFGSQNLPSVTRSPQLQPWRVINFQRMQSITARLTDTLAWSALCETEHGRLDCWRRWISWKRFGLLDLKQFYCTARWWRCSDALYVGMNSVSFEQTICTFKFCQMILIITVKCWHKTLI